MNYVRAWGHKVPLRHANDEFVWRRFQINFSLDLRCPFVAVFLVDRKVDANRQSRIYGAWVGFPYVLPGERYRFGVGIGIGQRIGEGEGIRRLFLISTPFKRRPFPA